MTEERARLAGCTVAFAGMTISNVETASSQGVAAGGVTTALICTRSPSARLTGGWMMTLSPSLTPSLTSTSVPKSVVIVILCRRATPPHYRDPHAVPIEDDRRGGRSATPCADLQRHGA